MIRTAMVGRQPIKKTFRRRGKEIATDLEPGLTNTYNLKMMDFVLADCIYKQVRAGIDILSEGECFRDDYWSYMLHFMDGIKVVMEGNTVEGLHKRKWDVFSNLKINQHFLANDWNRAQELTTLPVKITMPGPLTVATEVSEQLANGRKLSTEKFEHLVRQFIPIINKEILETVLRGCKHIQIDDPQLAYQPELAKEYGISCMSECFSGVPKDVMKFLHVCRGYTSAKSFDDSMDGKKQGKAGVDCYMKIMPALDKTPLDVISIENAYFPNPEALFEVVEKKTLMLGAVIINSNIVETPEAIAKTVENVLRFIPPERLILAPDCGCNCDSGAFYSKMENIAKVAKMF